MSKSALFSVPKHDPCPACGAELVIRSGKHGPFLGCVNYPTCDYIRPLKSQGDGHVVKVLEGHACPQCGADKVLRQGRFGMFVGCSHYPECDYTETIDKPDETRPSLVQGSKERTGGTSGLHRTAQELTALHREVRIRATETSPGGVLQGRPLGVKRAISARSNTK